MFVHCICSYHDPPWMHHVASNEVTEKRRIGKYVVIILALFQYRKPHSGTLDKYLTMCGTLHSVMDVSRGLDE